MREIPPGLAWLLVFGPAVLYFMGTRLGRSREYGLLLELGDDAVDVYQVADGFFNISDAVYRHDSELGRGYLLLSEAAEYGRVWRWELGGGPISIGKTLHLDQSGCRTLDCRNNHDNRHGRGQQRGSGALAIQFARDARSSREGSLLVAEWGEGRIVRLEEETGARTPVLFMLMDNDTSFLLVHKENLCQQTLGYPYRMVVSATGDLIVVGTYTFPRTRHTTETINDNDVHGSSECFTIPALVKVTNAVLIPALTSLAESRAAHAWRRLDHDMATRTILWADPLVSSIGGLAVTESTLYVSAVQKDFPVILKILLMRDDENDDENDDEEGMAKISTKSTVVATPSYDLSHHGKISGPLVVTEFGDLIVAVDSIVCRLNTTGGSQALLELPDAITSLVLGDDKYLYLTTPTKLYRHFLNVKPYQLPTNLLPRPLPTK